MDPLLNTKPEDVWGTASHFIGNILLEIRMTLQDSSKSHVVQQREIEEDRHTLVGCLCSLARAAREHERGDIAENIEKVLRAVQDADLADLQQHDAIQDLHDSWGPDQSEFEAAVAAINNKGGLE